MRRTMRLYLLTFSLYVFVGSLWIKAAYGQQVIIFGPETFTRSTGEPETFVRNFSLNLPLREFTISVQNGEGRHGRVSSAVVELNGTQVLGPEDFNQKVDLITKPVMLQAQNTLNVELRSAPGRAIVVTINGRFPSVSESIPATGGSVSLDGLALITFPDGAFAVSTTVQVSASNSPATHEDFSRTAEGSRVPYEIRINSGNSPPTTSFDVSLNVPASFMNSMPQDHHLQIFIYPLETSTTETIGQFAGYRATLDPTTNTLQARLPSDAFTDALTPDDTWEAILIVGVVPRPGPGGIETSSTESPIRSARREITTVASISMVGLLFATPPPRVCDGEPIGNPLERFPTEGSRFRPPAHFGTDYPGTLAENMHPVASGTITKIDFDLVNLPKPDPRSKLLVKGYGQFVIVTHNDGSQTRYGHLVPGSTNHLVEGQAVTPATVIGQLGTSGGSTGPHLHLEYSPTGNVRDKSSLVDPHPCVEEGIQPLAISPQNPTLVCGPDASVTFTASGGRGPYSWTTTKGVITPDPQNNAKATLKPPENPGSGIAGVAYSLTGCSFQFGGDCFQQGGARCQEAQYGCNDQLLVGCGGFTAGCLLGCAPQTCDTCKAGLASANYSLDDVLVTFDVIPVTPSCVPPRNHGLNLCTNFLERGIGRVIDKRTQSCKPCRLEMQGATVTVRDAAGASVSKTVTVK